MSGSIDLEGVHGSRGSPYQDLWKSRLFSFTSARLLDEDLDYLFVLAARPKRHMTWQARYTKRYCLQHLQHICFIMYFK